MDTILLRKLACALLIGTAALAGCGKDAASFVASAKSYIAKSDYKAAVIELKNAIQKAPENAEARYLLASALLESGDSAGAEAEVRKAIALHAPDDETYPLLARAVVGHSGRSDGADAGNREHDRRGYTAPGTASADSRVERAHHCARVSL